MKLNQAIFTGSKKSQPPSGGCELKRKLDNNPKAAEAQPPSGGCELKLFSLYF